MFAGTFRDPYMYTLFGDASPTSERKQLQVDHSTVQEETRPRKLSQQPSSSWMSSGANYNLNYDPKAKIQTGPAEPAWRWIRVRCGWNGPVTESQTLRPILISPNVHRALTTARVLLLLMLIGVLLGVRRLKAPLTPPPTPVVAASLFFGICGVASAELPNQKMLQDLQERLLEQPPVFPHGASIPHVQLDVTVDRITMAAEVHCAIEAAVPLPGRLPSWSPVSMQVDGLDNVLVRRHDGFMWIVLPEGVHIVTVIGMLPGDTEWEWSFALQPKRVSIDAPGWQVTGIRPNNVPEAQIFFARQIEEKKDQTNYDRKDFHPILVLERHLEIGLLWQVHNELSRVSPPGKAVSLRIPLLPDEKVLTPNLTIKDGMLEAKLGAQDTSFSWDSQLPIGNEIDLKATETDRWVEQWHLVTSPVWHANLSGLPPIIEGSLDLTPIWHPWPGESAQLSFSKPEPVEGETMTVRGVTHRMQLGSRRRTVTLQTEIESSQGDDLHIVLPADIEITSLTRDNTAIPVRRDDASLIVPVNPGKQSVTVGWQRDQNLGFQVTTDPVALPVDAANITTHMGIPKSQWVLWANGPLRGPAVRFWVFLAMAVLAAWVLGTLKLSPIGPIQWTLLVVGLTQVHVVSAVLVVAWFFFVAWRGKRDVANVSSTGFNFVQILLVGATALMLAVLVAAVGAGLLGQPEMFVRGNGSSGYSLNWFQPASGLDLPVTEVWTVSIWYYRFFMLAWALWLAAALIRWLTWGWEQFSSGGYWKAIKKKPRDYRKPPPLQSDQV